jgi:predicted metal-binding protein
VGGSSLYLPYINISLLPTFIIMICKTCNIKITKENTKKVSGGWRYKSKCLKCYQEDSKRRHKERYKRLKESRWF